MIKNTVLLVVACIMLTVSCKHDPFPLPPGACHPDTIYYSRDIQPILTRNCTRCHNGDNPPRKVNLTSYKKVIETADIDPGDPDGSKLYERINEDDIDKRMPKDTAPLMSSEINLIRRWIEQGAQNLRCGNCDTVYPTYSKDIEPIFSSCQGCHANNNVDTDRSLTNYGEVAQAVIDSSFSFIIQRVNGGNDSIQGMPLGGSLNECDIRKIEIWIKNEMPE